MRRRQIATALLLLSLQLPAAAQQETHPDAELRQRVREAVLAADSFTDRFDAEVWLLDMSTRLAGMRLKRLAADQHAELLRLVHREATRTDLDPSIVLSVIEVESRFDRFAISEAGARGLMQIMPFWLDEIGEPDANLFTPRTNLRIGTTILRYYLDRERGNLRRALARYNGSLGSDRYPNLVFGALNRRWEP